MGVAERWTIAERVDVRGDGHTLWKSEVVQADQLWPFQVKVAGVQKLELITRPTENGSGGDWGLWLEPTLRRVSEE